MPDVPLSIKNFTKYYIVRKHRKYIFKDLSIDFPKTGIVGILGENGAGKTTLIKACVNLITYEGDILYYGKKQVAFKDNIKHYSVLFEGNRNIYWKLTPTENIEFFAGLKGVSFTVIKDKVEYLMNILNISDKKDIPVELLSRGMQQKVALVIALSFDSTVIFLDEPTLGIDVETKHNLIKFLKEECLICNKLIIITSHDYDFVSTVCDERYIIKDLSIVPINQDYGINTLHIISDKLINNISPFLKQSEGNKFLYEVQFDLYQLLLLVTQDDFKHIISITKLD